MMPQHERLYKKLKNHKNEDSKRNILHRHICIGIYIHRNLLTINILTMNQIINLYLAYVNDFVTIEKFASWFKLDIEDAEVIIKMGKKYNERNAEEKKSSTNFTNKHYRWKR